MIRREKEPELSVYDVETEIEKRHGAKIIYEKIPKGWKSPCRVIDYARFYKQRYLLRGTTLSEGERLQLEDSEREIEKLKDEIKDTEKRGDIKLLAYLNSFDSVSQTTAQRIADETRPIAKKVERIYEKGRTIIEPSVTIGSRIVTGLLCGTATRAVRGDADVAVNIGPLTLRGSDIDMASTLLGYLLSGQVIESINEWREDKIMEKLSATKRRIYAEGVWNITKELKGNYPEAVEIKPDLARLYKDHKKFKRKFR